MKSTLRIFGLLALLVVAAAGTGCSSLTSDYCQLKCDCEGCSPNQLDECVIQQDSRAEQADVYDCGALHDDYLQCIVDQPPATLCDVANFRDPDACNAAKDRRDNCVGDPVRIDLRAP